jgi:isopentenyl-diphosphate delta-isomerase
VTSASEQRKRDHLALCASGEVAFKHKTTLFEQVHLVHRALPELAVDDIDLSTRFGGVELAAPLWIGAMTGGATGSRELNIELAQLASELRVGLCLGSMRPMLEDPSRKADFAVREAAEGMLVLGNIGATAIATHGPAKVLDALADIGADGIGIHLNPMMELIQPGGDRDFRGALDGIAALVEAAGDDLVVFVKETGCGLSWQDGEALKKAGVTRVEVAGAGGTSWVGVEASRASGREERLGRLLWDWGIPTAVSTAWMVDLGLEVVASGGVRTGLDAAKALALGASLVAVAAPLVEARAKGGFNAMRELLGDVVAGLRYTMLGCGAASIPALRHVPRVLDSELACWIESGWNKR